MESDVPHWLYVLGLDTVHSVCSSSSSVEPTTKNYQGALNSCGDLGVQYGCNLQLYSGHSVVPRVAQNFDPYAENAFSFTGYRVEGCDI